MADHREKIPGYKILIGAALAAAIVFGLTQLHFSTPFEKMTGYRDYDALIAAKIAYEEQVARSIDALGGPGDDFTKAMAGDAEAEYHLGIFYLYGNEHEAQDYREAMNWFQKSAAQKYAPAEYEVGRMFANGFGVDREPRTSIDWYLKAANGGYKWAQIHLGEIYMNIMAKDFGVERSYPEAYFWLTLGTADEDHDSDFVRDREDAASNLKPEQLEAVKKKVEAWKAAHLAPAAKP